MYDNITINQIYIPSFKDNSINYDRGIILIEIAAPPLKRQFIESLEDPLLSEAVA